MPITYPANRKEVSDRVKTDLQNELPQSDPFIRNSYISALATGYSGALYDAYKTIQILQTQLFPDTATGDFADRWGNFKGVSRNPASVSVGNITITGTLGSTIPTSTQLQTASGLQYITTNTSTLIIASTTLFVTQMSRSGSIVTVTTVHNHNFSTNDNVTISGSSYPEYNGTYPITVIADNQFTYTITTIPATPAIGIILAQLDCVTCPVVSISVGSNTVLESGSELIFTSLLPGIDSSAFVQFEGILGGVDQESDSDYRNRYLYVYQHPVSYFNDAAIILQAQKVPGVTRVFVQDTTPDAGQVSIYFTRDNDPNGSIPVPAEVNNVYQNILMIKPAHVDPDDIIVSAPQPIKVNFLFSILQPNTLPLQAAILASLQALFQEVPIVGQTLSKYAYQSAIYQTVDPTSGQFVTGFTLITPTGDITISPGQLAILGTVTFPTI
jgi:uncharacterized phage protein gp47/JayE